MYLPKKVLTWMGKRCGIDADHIWNDGVDETSGNDMTYTCERCDNKDTAPHGRPAPDVRNGRSGPNNITA